MGRVKKTFLICALFLCGAFFGFPWLASAAPAKKYAAIVIDARDGSVLHDENATDKRYPASLTKMMTLYLLFEDLESKRVKLGTRMKISKKASRQQPTKLGLKAGKKVTVKDALLGLMVKSANDAAVVIAEHLAGSEQAFAKRMTQKAHALGMTQTIFKNPHGLPNKNQVTTAYDMAILGRALYHRFPKYYKYVSLQSFWYQGKKYRNHNRLLGKVQGVDGIKTGYTNASGFNLVTSAIRDGVRLVAVVMGGKSSKTRDRRMAQLLEVSFKETLADQRLFLAKLSPAKKPFQNKPTFVLAKKSDTIVPPALPQRKLPELLPPVGTSRLAEVSSAAGQEPPSTDARKGPLALASLSSREAETSQASLASTRQDPIGEKIRKLDPIGDKIRRLNPPLSLSRRNPYWSVQVGAFAQAKEAHNVAVEHLARLSPSYDAVVSVTQAKQKRRHLFRARLSCLTEEEAYQICEELKKQGQRCLPIRPHRDPMTHSAQNMSGRG